MTPTPESPLSRRACAGPARAFSDPAAPGVEPAPARTGCPCEGGWSWKPCGTVRASTGPRCPRAEEAETPLTGRTADRPGVSSGSTHSPGSRAVGWGGVPRGTPGAEAEGAETPCDRGRAAPRSRPHVASSQPVTWDQPPHPAGITAAAMPRNRLHRLGEVRPGHHPKELRPASGRH